MIIIDDINEIIGWNMEKLWNAITQIEPEDAKEFDTELKQIESGIDIKVNINYIIKDQYVPYPERNSVKIKYYGNQEYIMFMDEIKKREKLARNILYILNQEEKIMKSPEGFEEVET